MGYNKSDVDDIIESCDTSLITSNENNSQVVLDEIKQALLEDICNTQEIKNDSTSSDNIAGGLPLLMALGAVSANRPMNDDTIKMIKRVKDYWNYSSIFKIVDEQAFVIWTLINLGYSDSEYSLTEKRIVDYLADLFELDKVLFMSMIDTAETVMSLIKQRKWIADADIPFEKQENMVKQIDKKIKQMYKNVELDVQEASLNNDKGDDDRINAKLNRIVEKLKKTN